MPYDINDYIELDGQNLDPKVYVDPKTNTPLPILVHTIGGSGGSTDVTTLAKEDKQDTLITHLLSLLAELQAKADLAETQPVSVASLPLPAGAATSLALLPISNNTLSTANSAIAIQAAIGANTDTYTPGLIRATASGTVAAGMFEVSVANVGIANGTVLGATIKPDEVVTFRCASGGHKLAVVAYDGTGTELLITTLLRV